MKTEIKEGEDCAHFVVELIERKLAQRSKALPAFWF